MTTKLRAVFGLLGAVGAMLSGPSAFAATVTYDFTTDPTTGPNPLVINQGGTFADSAGNSHYWSATGGNPGGFLAVTWPIGGSSTIVEFPNIDPGKIVAGFTLEADLRVGNPQQSDRAADGFSVSFARANDNVFINHSASDFGVPGQLENGTATGLVISFDTWSGNNMADGTRDFPDNGSVDDPGGIIVIVDNEIILRKPSLLYNGLCADTNSTQTGPKDSAYWVNAKADGSTNPLPDAAFIADSWATLCWQPLKVQLDTDGKVTVNYKNSILLDHFQTTFFPSAGGIVLAGRTGGADEHTHFDNLKLTTVAFEPTGGPPNPPTNLHAVETGARRVLLAWTQATNTPVAYQITRNGTLLPALITGSSYEDRGVTPGQAVNYSVNTIDLAARPSTLATLAVTTAAEVDSPGTLLINIYDKISGATIADLTSDASFPASPTRQFYANGLDFGETSNFGNTFGDNYGSKIEAVLTVPETGSYRFFVRSDDASAFFINPATGATIPNPATTPVAQQNGCCNNFDEPGAGDNGDGTFTTSAPIALTGGTPYGVLLLQKEGGGGDWAQVAMRKEGDLTPAAQLTPIRGTVLSGPGAKGDPIGASVTITQQPVPATVAENTPLTLTVGTTNTSPYANLTTIGYQWYKDGTAVLNANGATYTVPLVKKSQAGQYKVRAFVPGAFAVSSEVAVAVTPDTTTPKVVSATGGDSFTKITLVFSEPIAATTAANYTVAGLTVTGVATVNTLTSTTVTLTTSKQAENTSYPITLTGIVDTATPTPNGVAAADATVPFTSWVLTKGKVKYEYWDGIGGVDLQALKDDPRFIADTPTFTSIRDEYASPNGGGEHENFGGKLSCWITPAVSGSYTFYMSSDDHGELYLSTDDTPATKALIAMEPSWNNPREWVAPYSNGGSRDATNPENKSAPISLVAGKRYYSELLYKEGGGGDHGDALMVLSSVTPTNGTPALNGDQISAFAPPAPVVSTNTPTLAAVFSKTGVTLTYTNGALESAANVEGPFAPVAGATSPYPVTFGATARQFYRVHKTP